MATTAYTAILANGSGLMTVTATSEDEAREACDKAIRRNKVCRMWHAQWVRDGKLVKGWRDRLNREDTMTYELSEDERSLIRCNVAIHGPRPWRETRWLFWYKFRFRDGVKVAGARWHEPIFRAARKSMYQYAYKCWSRQHKSKVQ